MPRAAKVAKRGPYQIDVIERGLRVLRLFSPNRHVLSLREIAQGVRCVPSTTLRIVRTLCDLGFLQEMAERTLYRPGISAIRLGMSSVISARLHSAALPHLRALHRSTRRTVNLDVLLDGLICHVERFKESDILPAAIGIGSLFPAYCTAPGKLLMAFQSPEDRTRTLRTQSFTQLTPRTITSKTRMLEELREIKRTDVAIADCEMADDLRAISAPVRDQSGDVIAAVTMVGSIATLPLKKLRGAYASLVRAAATQISEALRSPVRRSTTVSQFARADNNVRGTSRYHITALSRGLRLLSMLSSHRHGLTISEIASRAGWTISTTFRVASTLRHLGYLENETSSGCYELTYQCLLLGYCASANLDLTEFAMPELQRLHQETRESVFLSLLAGAEIVSVVRLLRSEQFGTVGSGRFPAHATPNGKMLMAWLPDHERERLLKQTNWVSFTPKTITEPAQLSRELQKARMAGYAVTDDELVIGTRGIAAPIFDWDGECVAAVTISCAGNRLTLDEMIQRYCEATQATARRITALLQSRCPISCDVEKLVPEDESAPQRRFQRAIKY